MNLILFKQYTGIHGAIALTYVYLALVFALCLAFFVSSIVKKNSKGYLLVILIYFILSILSVFPYIDIYNPLTSLTLANNIIVYNDNVLSDYLINLFMTLGISIVLIISSIYIFKNKIDNRK
jgi:ABC-2 type transport system permease protein